MSGPFGERAIVIGAGIGGLAAARALADHFADVVVLERDALPADAAFRSGTPQARHSHGLLVGGQRALGEIFPGFEDDLVEAGAIALRAGLDVLNERPGYDPFPRRDLGIRFYSASRPLIELTVRKRLQRQTNIALRENCRALAIAASPDGARVVGVRVEAEGKDETLPADLVIDASGRGALTLDLLKSLGRPAPEETKIGIDIAYATGIFSIPSGGADDFKGCLHFPAAPAMSRGSVMLPIEGARWMVALGGVHGDEPPADEEGFRAFARSFRTPTVFNAISRAELLSPIARYRLPGSVKRHFERLRDFPRGLLPLGDAVCRFNPLYGQGMSVAAQEACLVRRLLGEAAADADPRATLAASYFAALPTLLEAPWSTAALDLIFPQTIGERPPEFERRMMFGAGLLKLAARDAEVHRLFYEVNNLIKPPSVYQNPDLQRRVMAALAEG